MNDSVAATGIGARVLRREDFRFIKGRGKYVDDIVLPRQTYATIVRSPYAHATINAIDISAAVAMAGVVKVMTAADFEAYGGLPCGWLVNNQDGSPMAEPKHPILAEGKVRHVGDPVAVVIAESKAAANAPRGGISRRAASKHATVAPAALRRMRPISKNRMQKQKHS